MQIDAEKSGFRNSKHTQRCASSAAARHQSKGALACSFQALKTSLTDHSIQHLTVKARAGQTIVTLNDYVKSRLYSENRVNDILNTLEIQTTCCCCFSSLMFYCSKMIFKTISHAYCNCRSTIMNQQQSIWTHHPLKLEICNFKENWKTLRNHVQVFTAFAIYSSGASCSHWSSLSCFCGLIRVHLW